MPEKSIRARFLAQRLLFLVAGCLCLGSCHSGPRPRTYRIGFAQCGASGPWRQAMQAGMKRELLFHPDAQLQMLNSHGDSNLQIQQIQQLLRAGVDLLIVSPNEAVPLTPVVAEAYERGIPVVLLDRRTASQKFTAFVGGNNVLVGQTAAQYAARLLHDHGSVVEILGTPGSSPATGRHQGFVQGLQTVPGIRLVGQVTGDWLPQPLKPALRSLLQAHPEVRLIFAHNDGMARGAYEVCQELARTRHIRIIGVDGLASAQGGIELVSHRQLSASLLYPPGGEEAIRTALAILRHQKFERENELATIVIDSTNVTTMRQQTEQVALQQKEIEQQQDLLVHLRTAYVTQRQSFGLAVALLLTMVVLAALIWWTSRRHQRLNEQLLARNQQNVQVNAQLVAQNQEIAQQRNQLEALAHQIQTQSDSKLRFFTNFAHELRTPLTLVLGPLEELSSGANLTATQQHDLVLMRRNTQRLLQLVNQLLDFRKIEAGSMVVRATRTDLVRFVQHIVEVFEQPARRRGVRLQFETCVPTLLLWFDGLVLDKVLMNLLANALKFTPQEGKISVFLEPGDEEDTWQIRVRDTGPGIDEQEQAHIFEWFYQGSSAVAGSGLGLALARELMQLHQGRLTCRSQVGRGSTFTMCLPRTLPPALRATGLVGSTAFALAEPSAPASGLEELAPPAAEAALVLVVEDNQEVRDFLLSRLQAHFRVRAAADGRAGLQLATELIPDLVVCDIMMPEVDGLEVVTRLRADWRTSHIPVILLTACDAPEQQLTGVQAGTDLYLTKPFNPALLVESIRTLLRNRARQWEFFQHQLPLTNPSTAPADPQQQFIAILTAVVEANLTKTDLSVEEVASTLGISRMQLYRKVKATLGVSASDFIQHARLAKAQQLLPDATLTIAQVAYESGFSSPSYFATCFRAHYHLTPTEFRVRHAAPIPVA